MFLHDHVNGIWSFKELKGPTFYVSIIFLCQKNSITLQMMQSSSYFSSVNLTNYTKIWKKRKKTLNFSLSRDLYIYIFKKSLPSVAQLCCHIGNHPQGDLAMFGYRSASKVEKKMLHHKRIAKMIFFSFFFCFLVFLRAIADSLELGFCVCLFVLESWLVS